MSARIINDGFSDVYLYRAIGVSGFPNDEFLITMQAKLFLDTGSYQTYMAGASTSFGGGNEYWTAADFNSPHRRSIGSDGSDTVHGSATPTPPGIWARMAFQRLNTGGGNHEQRWWIWDINGDNEVEVLRTDSNNLVYEAAARLSFGSVPYTTNEGVNGWLRCLKAFSAPKTKAIALAESAHGGIATADGASDVWGRWPLISSGVDVSGNGRDLSIELNGAAATELTFDGAPDPQFQGIRTMDRIRRPALFAPGIAR